MCPQILNTVGLVFNMTGIIILFCYGFPQPTHEESTGLAIQGPIADKNAEQARKIKAKYLCLSKTALGLIILGFIFQLGATWISNSHTP
jgi:hypothetical protein